MSDKPVKEQVPSYEKRQGDRVVEGSNNVTVILGTDRPSDINSGFGTVNSEDGGKNSGTYHVIVGRENKDPDFKNDKAFIYVSSKSNIDDNLDLDIEEKNNKISAAIVKADSVRIIARQDVKITAGDGAYIYLKQDGRIVLDGNKIELGSGAVEQLIKGNEFLRLFLLHKHPTAVGLTGPVVEPIQQQFEQTLSKQKTTVK